MQGDCAEQPPRLITGAEWTPVTPPARSCQLIMNLPLLAWTAREVQGPPDLWLHGLHLIRLADEPSPFAIIRLKETSTRLWASNVVAQAPMTGCLALFAQTQSFFGGMRSHCR